MRIDEKIEKYLNESTKYDKKIINYIKKTYPNVNELGIILSDGKKWYSFEYAYDELELQTSNNDFNELGIGDESDWDSEKEEKLRKILNVKKVYIIDL